MFRKKTLNRLENKSEQNVSNVMSILLSDKFKTVLFINKIGRELVKDDTKTPKIKYLKNFANTYGLITDNKGENVCFIGHDSVLQSYLVYQSKQYPGLRAWSDTAKISAHEPADDMTYGNKTIEEMNKIVGIHESQVKHAYLTQKFCIILYPNKNGGIKAKEPR